ncbi:hypothetical protein M569_02550 [Genlisea aurea]|uniref:Zinc finger PHD-type domain-containing protein n=1 Tax=Genlisea aurea TaxID=192259 RepID=S8E8M9_9LAMI|nr:hypothetical protein M569_02550 [Genlisea aurea]
MDISVIDACIKCNKGGRLLSCFTESCPLFIHEGCLGFPARYDGNGRFYCPYCAYKNTVAELRQAERFAVSCKKNLMMFMRGVEENAEKFKGISRDEEKKIHGELDGNVHGAEPGTSSAALFVQPLSCMVNGNTLNFEDKGNKTSSPSKRHDLLPRDEEIEPHLSSESEFQVNDDQRLAIVVYTGQGTSSERDDVRKSDETPSFHRRSYRVSSSAPAAAAASKMFSGYRFDPSLTMRPPRQDIGNLGTNEMFEWRPRKRNRTKSIAWKPEEIAMLKRGVELFRNEKKIPWKKVLEMGIGVFDEFRSPSDLKGQWNNLRVKKSGGASQ